MERSARLIVFAYGAVCYVGALVVFGLLIIFLADVTPLSRTVDSGPKGPVWLALLADTLLVAGFGLQHSLMARRGFKRWWTRLVPPTVERSTYVLATCLVLGLVFALWRPIPLVLWRVEPGWARTLLWSLDGLGWATVFGAAELLDARRLLGLRQVWHHLHGTELAPLPFMAPGPYRWVRHPMMAGFLAAFWAAPTMTAGHLLFSLSMTGYILVGMRLEERDLVHAFGDRYRTYRRRVAMLVPRPSLLVTSRNRRRPHHTAPVGEDTRRT